MSGSSGSLSGGGRLTGGSRGWRGGGGSFTGKAGLRGVAASASTFFRALVSTFVRLHQAVRKGARAPGATQANIHYDSPPARTFTATLPPARIPGRAIGGRSSVSSRGIDAAIVVDFAAAFRGGPARAAPELRARETVVKG